MRTAQRWRPEAKEWFDRLLVPELHDFLLLHTPRAPILTPQLVGFGESRIIRERSRARLISRCF
jgi:hypothetical protein